MLHNEEVYTDPHTFNPDRFIDCEKVLDNHFKAVFGFGRRLVSIHINWLG